MSEDNKQEYNPLTSEEEAVILFKGTERPFTGEFNDFSEAGTYHCKRCDAELYKSDDKFSSQCGWPSFDDEIPGAIKRVSDADGMRTEIVCNNCGAHLGHVFEGENLTDKNVRHCVNSISMTFVPADSEIHYEKAYFAGGCFWGMEYYFQNAKGVISTTVGYMGGNREEPTYAEVCTGTTGHIETIEVVFDSKVTSYEAMARLFFEIHDPTQVNRQGPDVGYQYRSAVFYQNPEQKDTAQKLINILKGKGYKVATELIDNNKFWAAENYHQDYYAKKLGQPYCHIYEQKF
ncbi:MAG: bifunctional methionine sulfoxide reductase B/A protein [Candidatus Zixiibacteriota bacterium]